MHSDRKAASSFCVVTIALSLLVALEMLGVYRGAQILSRGLGISFEQFLGIVHGVSNLNAKTAPYKVRARRRGGENTDKRIQRLLLLAVSSYLICLCPYV